VYQFPQFANNHPASILPLNDHTTHLGSDNSQPNKLNNDKEPVYGHPDEISKPVDQGSVFVVKNGVYNPASYHPNLMLAREVLSKQTYFVFQTPLADNINKIQLRRIPSLVHILGTEDALPSRKFPGRSGALSSCIDHWKKSYPHLTLMNWNQVDRLHLVQVYFPEYVALYKALQSQLQVQLFQWMVLHTFGGMTIHDISTCPTWIDTTEEIQRFKSIYQGSDVIFAFPTNSFSNLEKGIIFSISHHPLLASIIANIADLGKPKQAAPNFKSVQHGWTFATTQYLIAHQSIPAEERLDSQLPRSWSDFSQSITPPKTIHDVLFVNLGTIIR
jgi:hypothetical protein